MRIYIYSSKNYSVFIQYEAKKKKRLRNSKIFTNYPIYLFKDYLLYWVIILDKEKKWMLMTYYCPIHGDSGIVEPIEISKKEIRETFLKKGNNPKKNF